MSNKLDGRFYSLDLTRGIIVILSVFLSNIPEGGYEYLRHSPWYGVTIIDFILPAFITIFGTGMAFAYKNGVRWGSVTKRTIRLILYGLLFNMLVLWEVNFQTLRFTGVLQLFAVLGVASMVIAALVKKEKVLAVIAFLILLVHGSFLMGSSTNCQSGLPQPDCNPSGIVDQAIFGVNHMYHQGLNGFDPEGIFTMFAAISNVLFGYIAGRFILKRRQENAKAWKELLLLGVILIIISYFVSWILPYNKRLWSPSFALLTGGSTVGLLALLHLCFDRGRPLKFTRLIEAFGRNSFFVYFGKFVLASLMGHIMVTAGEKETSVSQVLLTWIEANMGGNPQFIYAAVITLLWTIIVVILYKNKWYIKV